MSVRALDDAVLGPGPSAYGVSMRPKVLDGIARSRYGLRSCFDAVVIFVNCQGVGVLCVGVEVFLRPHLA